MDAELAIASLTAKYQATIPLPVRKALGLEKGDKLVFEIAGGSVVVRRAVAGDIAFVRAVESTLSEWNSPEDDEAFRDV